MWRRRFLCLASVLVLLTAAAPEARLQAQTPIVVAFVAERDLQTASAVDTGPDGVSTLADIFRSLGADVQLVRLSEELPEAAKVVVFVRPVSSIPPDFLARLWRHIENGNHLLFTIDPVGYPNVGAERESGGIGRLLTSDYGVNFRDTFLAKPWFTYQTIANLPGSTLSVYGDILPHPITAPLAAYDLPIQVWGARTMRIEPFGVASFASTLLSTRAAYGETNLGIFTGADPDPRFEVNLESDSVGRLIVAGVGRNTRTGSRIVVLGDSELTQNGYGLARLPSSSDTDINLPLFPGNQIFMERVAAWLLDLPPEQWPALPARFTWLKLDGDVSDWNPNLPPASDQGDSEDASYDIQQTRAFYNDSYLYLAVETRAAPKSAVRLKLELESPGSLAGVVTIYAANNRVTAALAGAPETLAPDAKLAAGRALELRVPLRVTGINETLNINRVCLAVEDANPLDCQEGPLPALKFDEHDPTPLDFPDGPLVTVNSPDRGPVNLRSGPGTDFDTITFLASGVLLAATGRNEAGDWIQVQDARYSGWIVRLLATPNADVMSLPVVAGP